MGPRTPGSRRGFTLIELLLAMGVIAVLAAILLPTLAAVTRSARITATQNLLSRLDVAIVAYKREQSVYLPDFVPPNARLRRFVADDTPPWTVSTGALPPEALYYYLANPFLSGSHPFAILSKGREYTDINGNGLPEIIDPWSRPILYNRDPFPNNAFSYGIPTDGLHKVGFYDLYSVGPDGATGASSVAIPDVKDTASLAFFCQQAIRADRTGGTGGDDITNWKR